MNKPTEGDSDRVEALWQRLADLAQDFRKASQDLGDEELLDASGLLATVAQFRETLPIAKSAVWSWRRQTQKGETIPTSLAKEKTWIRSIVQSAITEHSGDAEKVAEQFMVALAVLEKLQFRAPDYPRSEEDLAYWSARNDAKHRVATRIRKKLVNPQGNEQEAEAVVREAFRELGADKAWVTHMYQSTKKS